MSMLAIAVFEKNVPKPNVANPRTASVVNRLASVGTTVAGLSSSAVTCRAVAQRQSSGDQDEDIPVQRIDIGPFDDARAEEQHHGRAR